MLITVGCEDGSFKLSSDTVAPTPPTDLSAVPVSSSQIDLSWTASTDDVGVAGYQLNRGNRRIADVDSTTYSDTGLRPGTTYSYTVNAYDTAGNTSESGAVTATTPSDSSGSVAVWDRHVVKLSGEVTGNPFEVVLDGVFTHQGSGEVIRMPGFYDGGGLWKVAFMPTRPGGWSYRTESGQTDLDGITGTVDATASNREGLLEPDPSAPRKWRVRGEGNVVPIALRMEFFAEPASLDEFDAAADLLAANHVHLMETRLLEEYGMWEDGRHDYIFSGSWRDHEFDLDVWQRMQRRMDALAERGLGAHIMLYADEAGQPGWGGQSTTEALVIRYVVARLATYPWVVWNTGIDIREYRSESDIDWLGGRLRSLDPYDHPRSSRMGGGSGTIVMDDESYRSFGAPNTAHYSEMLSARSSVSVPVSFDDGFGENRGSHPEKDHTPADIRRAAWKSLMVGGAGMLIRGAGDGLSQDGFYSIHRVESDWESEQWLRLLAPFVAERIGPVFGAMEPAGDLVSGTGLYALADPGRERILYFSVGVNDTYDSGGGDITLLLTGESGAWQADWFDPRDGSTFSAGSFASGSDYVRSPPSDDDWLLLLTRS